MRQGHACAISHRFQLMHITPPPVLVTSDDSIGLVGYVSLQDNAGCVPQLEGLTRLAGETGTNSGSAQAASEGTVTSVAGMDNSTSGLMSSSTFMSGMPSSIWFSSILVTPTCQLLQHLICVSYPDCISHLYTVCDCSQFLHDYCL